MDHANNWDNSYEKLCEKYADECMIREQLHRNSFYYYSRWNNYLQMPIIILSAVIGSFKFLSQSFTEFEKNHMANIIFTSLVKNTKDNLIKYKESESYDLKKYNKIRTN